MDQKLPEFVPLPHRQVIDRIIARVSQDDRFVGVGVGGSYLTGAMDEFSDIDFLLAVEPDHDDEVMSQRKELAGTYGRILSSFTGEHVGEPRLLICLYAEPLMHVDLMFTSLDNLIDKPLSYEVIWERDRRISSAAQPFVSNYKEIEDQWVEDRFWVWIHYLAVKIGRGELFETLDGLAFIRCRVFGPLISRKLGLKTISVRRIEQLAPEYSEPLSKCVAGHNVTDCLAAVRACIAMYRSFRAEFEQVALRTEAERAAIEYLNETEHRFLV